MLVTSTDAALQNACRQCSQIAEKPQSQELLFTTLSRTLMPVQIQAAAAAALRGNGAFIHTIYTCARQAQQAQLGMC